MEDVPKDESGQASADYIVGITLFLFGVFVIFQISSSIVSPLYGKTNERQFIAEAVSDYLLIEFSDSADNVVNLTKMQTLLSSDDFIDEIGLSGYSINVSVKTINGLEIASAGRKLPYYADFGYVKRFMVSDSFDEPMVMEVYIW
jgi:hypothetical protein